MYKTVRLKGVLLAFLVVFALVAGVCAIGATHIAKPVSTNVRQGKVLPIIMYHGILKDPAMQGEYVISPDTLENDMKYLTENGYTTVNIADLIGYVNGRAGLPEKPVMLTFDDGYYNNYLYAYPLAQKYSCKLVIAPIGYYTQKFSDTPDEHATYSHMTWGQIKEMDASGLVEFQNHSYNLHASKGRLGTRKLKSESDEEYSAMLTKDLTLMQEAVRANLGKVPAAFVYPFGAISAAEPGIVKGLGFQATLTCESRVNYITQEPECLYSLGRFLRPLKKSSASFFASMK